MIVLLPFEKTKIILNGKVYFMVVFAKAFNSFGYSNRRQMLQMQMIYTTDDSSQKLSFLHY